MLARRSRTWRPVSRTVGEDCTWAHVWPPLGGGRCWPGGPGPGARSRGRWPHPAGTSSLPPAWWWSNSFAPAPAMTWCKIYWRFLYDYRYGQAIEDTAHTNKGDKICPSVRYYVHFICGLDTARVMDEIQQSSVDEINPSGWSVWLPMPRSQQSWVRSQHPPIQWNLRGGRWSNFE